MITLKSLVLDRSLLVPILNRVVDTEVWLGERVSLGEGYILRIPRVLSSCYFV